MRGWRKRGGGVDVADDEIVCATNYGVYGHIRGVHIEIVALISVSIGVDLVQILSNIMHTMR